MLRLGSSLSPPTKIAGYVPGAKGAIPPKLLAYLNLLCFETRCPKPSTVARLNLNYVVPKKFVLATLLLWKGPDVKN